VKLKLPSTDIEKYRDIKFNENPSNGSRVSPRGQTDRQTDMTQLIAAFRNFANAPRKRSSRFHDLALIDICRFDIQLRSSSNPTGGRLAILDRQKLQSVRRREVNLAMKVKQTENASRHMPLRRVH
jgi:hypothetical protein